jgi:hypothetical protein
LAGIVAQRELDDPTLLGTFGMISVIPEPSSLLLAALGIVGLVKGRRMRRIRSGAAG